MDDIMFDFREAARIEESIEEIAERFDFGVCRPYTETEDFLGFSFGGAAGNLLKVKMEKGRELLSNTEKLLRETASGMHGVSEYARMVEERAEQEIFNRE